MNIKAGQLYMVGYGWDILQWKSLIKEMVLLKLFMKMTD